LHLYATYSPSVPLGRELHVQRAWHLFQFFCGRSHKLQLRVRRGLGQQRAAGRA
jgi:hypothetical protein